ncbi:probable Histone-lysine N-methyltransferase ATXR5 isoform X2 [Gossypium arboreum]|uniref:probable Histone-lysine N-methyltransferase ATXR5 isoform X2 n=1 Tax=Gossypium arboreum TaxID=29729 RepID=UPI0022F1A1B1|nr:probable Histone-lysine N-methyltransferase ATXR5 isoform X2 [Gossypium arboreum]
MAPATIMAGARRLVSSRRRTEAPRRRPSPSTPPKKLRPMSEIMARAKYAVVERADYSDIICEQCGSGERPGELLLCDKCDKGFHMRCLRPIVVRIPIGSWLCPKCSGHRRKRIIDFFKIQKSGDGKKKCNLNQDTRKRRRRPLVLLKKRRRLLPFIPSEDPNQRLKQMGTLASALTAMQMEFSDDLTYSSDMAPRSANQAKFENGGMQVLSREDMETLELCRSMSRRGECPPFIVVFDSCEGYLYHEIVCTAAVMLLNCLFSIFILIMWCSYTVEADAQIKDMTFIAEYTGDVDYIKNRENDDCDSMMTLLLATNPSESLVICPDKRGNIARFINGINNHTPEGKKKQNCKCVRVLKLLTTLYQAGMQFWILIHLHPFFLFVSRHIHRWHRVEEISSNLCIALAIFPLSFMM